MFFSINAISILAQNQHTKVADNLANKYEYVKAIQEYLKVVKKGNGDAYTYKQLGDCYYNIFDTKKAEQWYSKSLILKQEPEVLYRYALVLKSNLKYEDSNIQMEKFAALKPKDWRAKEYRENPDYLDQILAKENIYDITKLKINSNKSDFGGTLVGKIFYFASARNRKNEIYGWKNEPFLDLYESVYNEARQSFSSPKKLKNLNTKYHEGPVSITKDGKTMYFSSESFNENLYQKDKPNKLKRGQVNLYKSIYTDGNWSSGNPLPFNSQEYSLSNPVIDCEGKVLYFSSNMPGSIGGIDIWKVEINDDGSFGRLKNLGENVNTEGDETFPFISDDNILYFSSNRWTGLGGFDVFSVDLAKNQKPQNLGEPVNSEKDDFAFTFNKEKNIGFVSSNRLGQDNIYSIRPIENSRVRFVVKDSQSGILLSDSRIVIMKDVKSVLDNINSDDKGTALYEAKNLSTFAVEVFKDGYYSKKYPVNKNNVGETVVNILLDPLDVIVSDTEIILKPIYFRFDKSEITKQGAEELDKLVYIMSQNENMVIFVRSHTDSRGNNNYNLRLSEARAKSTIEYIISKGIDPKRISGKGYGETQPKIDCKANCTVEEHATNRRSEFMIVKR